MKKKIICDACGRLVDRSLGVSPGHFWCNKYYRQFKKYGVLFLIKYT